MIQLPEHPVFWLAALLAFALLLPAFGGDATPMISG